MSNLVTIQVPREYGYVLLTAATSYLYSNWLGVRITPYRKAAKVAHPSVSVSAETIANAPSAEQKRALYLFNCAQRGHHNFIENYTPMLTGMLISGLSYPKFAAAAGAVWIIGRTLYVLGYTSTSEKNVDGEGRWAYGGFYLAALSQTAFVVAVSKMGLDMLMT